MAQHVLDKAAELLVRRYGRRPVARPDVEWRTLVTVVLDQGGGVGAAADSSWIDETPLCTPAETTAESSARLAELLKAGGRRARHADVLPALAKWWLQNFDGAVAADFGERPLQAWQEELRSLRGVNWELADRILLLVGGLAVYPLDRGTLRIAARHGWMDMTAEYDDWQAFLVRGAQEAGIALADMAEWNARVGKEFCGRRPKCDDCPLKSLLPARGPVALDSDE